MSNFQIVAADPGDVWLILLMIRELAEWEGFRAALMAKLADIALQAKAARIEWFVDKNNTQALAFYEGLGVTVVDAIRVVRLDGDSLGSLAAKSS